MITATVIKNNDNYRSFICEGHAGYDDSGKDVVCAAVSMLVINTGNSLEALTDNNVRGVDDGVLRWDFLKPPDEKGVLLMDSLILGLETIRKKYGNDYLKLMIEEV
jgi:hypothetical protein